MKNLLKQIFNPDLKLTDEEKLIYRLVIKLINHPESRFKHAPLSQDILICNPQKEYSLLINNSRIKVVTPRDSSDNSFRASFLELVKEKLYDKMEQEKQVEIKEIFSRNEGVINAMIKNL